ncbi:MAG TPA: hypothetical protein VFU22_12845 [Roseiflexaceae bacterium]|nr:hypothetical protein [Roseiflexaceae bacterium]
MLMPTTNTLPLQIFSWALRHETWLHRKMQRAVIRWACKHAYACFAAEHPLWAESLFDAHFLAHAAAPLVARAIEPSNRPTPAEFAAAWFAQCSAPGASARDANLVEVAMAAAEFMHHLDAALQPYQVILR